MKEYVMAHDTCFNPGEEQKFKNAVIGQRRDFSRLITVFEIENEEKVPGFPDTLEMSEACYRGMSEHNWSVAQLVEYKVSDYEGVIDFQPRQPHFYKSNDRLAVVIRAWSVPEKKAYEFTAIEAVEAMLKKSADGKMPLKLSILKGNLA